MSKLAGAATTGEPRPRARDLGIAPGVFPPGPLNAITDVTGYLRGEAILNAALAKADIRVDPALIAKGAAEFKALGN